MKPAAFLSTLLFTQNIDKSEPFNNIATTLSKPLSKPSFVGRETARRLSVFEPDGVNESQEGGENYIPYNKEKYLEHHILYDVANNYTKSLVKKIKNGANPNLDLGNGNTLAHLIADKKIGAKDTDEHINDNFEVIRQLAISGIDFTKKNNDGLTAQEVTNKRGNVEIALAIGMLQEQQLQAPYDIDDIHNQMFNIVSQRNPSDIAMKKVVALVQAGADLNATRGDIGKSLQEKEAEKDGITCLDDEAESYQSLKYNSKSILEVAKQNWRPEKVDKLINLAKISKNISNSLYQFKLNEYEPSQVEGNKVDSINTKVLQSYSSWDIATKEFLGGVSRKDTKLR
jgi:hypothetical protein